MDRPRLYRSSENRIIAGVAGGIAEYFHQDPSLVRLLWVLVIFLGGAGILAYLIAWLIIPAQARISPEGCSTPGNDHVSPPETRRRQPLLWGAALIGLGLFFLVVQLFSINLHKFFWPIILIGAGIILLTGTGRRGRP